MTDLYRPNVELNVVADHWSSRGEAVVKGRVPLFVWQGIPGERARVRVLFEGQNRAVGQWVEGRPESEDRLEPPCDRYHPCGGCPVLHLRGAAQREMRRLSVVEALEREGIMDVVVDPVVAAPRYRDFRHLIKLGAGYSDQGHPRIGAFGRGDRRIVPIPSCLVATPALREVMKILSHHALDMGIRPWAQGRGSLRYVVARESALTGEVLITLVAGSGKKYMTELAELVELNCAPVVGIHLHTNEGDGNAIFTRDEQGLVGTRRLVGKGFIVDRLAGVDYRIGPGDFFQTHPAMADILYRDVVELAGATEGVPVLDLYSGVGGFALALAAHTGWAMGIEAVDGAVRRARDAASAAGITAEFTQGTVAEALPEVSPSLKGKRPVVVVDPARRGLEEGVVEGIMGLDPRRLVYVSCNPNSLARDLRPFLDAGWTLGTVRPYDMFPHTSHVEVVAIVDPPEGGNAPTGRGPRRRVVR